MDGIRFDRLVRELLGSGSRRGLLRHLSALPLAGALASLLDEEESDAKKRRQGKKRRQDNRAAAERKKRKNKKKCKSKAKVCAGKCGTVTYKCHKRKKQANCGPCACEPPCGECEICNAESGACVANPNQFGDDCGQTGQVCQADGNCVCDATSCPACAICQGDGICSTPCDNTGCCADGSCEDGNTEAACGKNGETCAVCSGDTPICVNGECVGCSGSNPCPSGQVCCGSQCFSGDCCVDTDCGSSGNACDDNVCRCGNIAACDGSTPDCCGTSTCTDTQSDPDNCGGCGNVCSDITPVCSNGTCTIPPCNVCAGGCTYDSVQAAINDANAGATIHVCEGEFTENLTIDKSLTIVGAGQGDGPGSTVLQGDISVPAPVVTIAGGTVSLHQMRITGGGAATINGGGILNQSALELADVTITGNTGQTGGGIYNAPNAHLTITGCTITGNAADSGAGIANDAGTFDAHDSVVSDNTATSTGGGISNAGAPGGTASLIACQISDNTVENGAGGGIFDEGTTLTLTDSHVSGNAANFSSGSLSGGGGIYIGQGSEVTLSTIEVSNNTSATVGGGILLADGTLALGSSSHVRENEAATDGGGILNQDLVNCVGDSNVTDNVAGNPLEPSDCIDDGGGGCNSCTP